MKALHLIIAGSLPLMLAGTAFAAEGAEGEGGGQGFILDVDPGAAVWNLAMFLILLFVLGKFVWPHVLQGLQAREAKIRSEIESAEAANQQAKETLDEYQQKLAAAHAEARQLVDQARQDADAVRKRMISETEQEISRMRQRATDQIDQAKQAAVQDLYDRSADLAVSIAGKLLQREIAEQDARQLIDNSLDEMEELHRVG